MSLLCCSVASLYTCAPFCCQGNTMIVVWTSLVPCCGSVGDDALFYCIVLLYDCIGDKKWAVIAHQWYYVKSVSLGCPLRWPDWKALTLIHISYAKSWTLIKYRINYLNRDCHCMQCINCCAYRRIWLPYSNQHTNVKWGISQFSKVIIISCLHNTCPQVATKAQCRAWSLSKQLCNKFLDATGQFKNRKWISS